MSYCRKSADSDVYLYAGANGFVCSKCELAPLVPTIRTVGCTNHWNYGTVQPCPHCNAAGCPACMVHADQEFDTYPAAITHLEEHRASGARVPDTALATLRREQEQEESTPGGTPGLPAPS